MADPTNPPDGAADSASEIQTVTAKTRIYLPGGNHGFRPGDSVPLPASVIAELRAAGHLDAVKQLSVVSAQGSESKPANEHPSSEP